MRHAPGAARRATAAPLAAEGDELVAAAVAAAKTQETVGQDAALKEGVELVRGRSAAGRLERRLRPARRTSSRAAAPGGTAWSARGGGGRSGPGRHRVPGGAAAPRLARVAHIEAVVLHGLRPSAAPPWPLLAPTSGRPPQGVNALLELLAFMWAIAKKLPITAPAGDGQVPDGGLTSPLACNVVGAQKDP